MNKFGNSLRGEKMSELLKGNDKREVPCIILIGMPGSGKSTVGAQLARRLGWAFMDTDFLLEALYAVRLQDVVDRMGKNEFLDAEAALIQSIKARRCVIATGGSVIYSVDAMRHLQGLGAIIYLETNLSTLLERIAENPERGIAIEEGQSLEDLYKERVNFYAAYADYSCCTAELGVEECVEKITNKINAGLFSEIKGRLVESRWKHD